MDRGQQTLFYCLAQFDNMHIMHIMHCDNPLQHNLYPLEFHWVHIQQPLNACPCPLYIHVKHAEMFLANAIFKLHENS